MKKQSPLASTVPLHQRRKPFGRFNGEPSLETPLRRNDGTSASHGPTAKPTSTAMADADWRIPAFSTDFFLGFGFASVVADRLTFEDSTAASSDAFERAAEDFDQKKKTKL